MTDALLKTIIDSYLKSRDFNGYYISSDASQADLDAAKQLVRDELAQVVSEEDFINPHIRPWPSMRTTEQQVESLDRLPGEAFGLCLYPTPKALKSVRVPKRFKDHPFSAAQAKGRGDLELAYFSFDVLEQYRNDPRYDFQSGDFGVTMGITDEAYLDGEELERDKVSLSHIGFAYDLSKYNADDTNSPIIRRVAAFYHDLATLTPEHQQRWKSYQVPDDGLMPHHVWYMAQMGHWPDGLGPFQTLFQELANINALWERAWGEPLFTHTDRPKDFGWILRPSQREWDDFVRELDKLLSDNMRHDALTASGAPRTNGAGDNLGTLMRLAEFMKARKIPDDIIEQILKPLRDVRLARQKPAHALRTNVTDKTYVHRQVALVQDVIASLANIRQWLSTHPLNRDWKPAHGYDQRYRM